MRKAVFVVSLFVIVLSIGSISANVTGTSLSLSKGRIFPGDSLIIKDTVKLANGLLLVTSILKVTDTVSRPVIVNGQWLKKKVTVTEYFSLSADTIYNIQSNSPVTNAAEPPAAPANSGDAQLNRGLEQIPVLKPTTKKQQENNPTKQHSAQASGKEKKQKPEKQPKQVKPNKADSAQASGKEKKQKPEKQPKQVKPDKADLAQASGKEKKQKPEKQPKDLQVSEKSANESSTAAELETANTVVNELETSSSLPNTTTENSNATAAENVSIEIFNQTRVVGIRTDVKENEQLPAGGYLIVSINQPQTTNSQSVTDKISAPNDANSANLPERVVLETKSVTMSEAYQLTLADIKEQQTNFAKVYKKAKTEQEKQETLTLAGRYLEEIVANDIVYYWYGTGFDKEGTTASPGSGRIACSYFVVTMLTEAGLIVDRIKLSQQSAESIVRTLAGTENVTRCVNPDEVEVLLKKKGVGLYFIGFNYHVGYLYYDGTDIYLIHASPLPPGTVSRIPMQGARSFEYSNYYDIGKLTDNKTLVINWLTGKKLAITP